MDEKYKKDFDKWNEVKKDINSKFLPVEFFFLEGEIWWASLGVNIGEEIDGKHDNSERPILVLKKFSENTLWVLPITSSEIEPAHSYKLKRRKINGFVSLTQLRFISGNRLLRYVIRLNSKEFTHILNKVIFLLSETIPPPQANW